MFSDQPATKVNLLRHQRTELPANKETVQEKQI